MKSRHFPFATNLTEILGINRRGIDGGNAGATGTEGPALETLEPRMLFSAAPVEAPAEANDAPEPEAAQESVAADGAASASSGQGQVADATGSGQTDSPTAPAANGETAVASSQNVTLVDLNPASAALNQETLDAIADAAAERWRASGLTPEQSAALDSISYQIGDLGGNHLGVVDGFSITIDDDAGSEAWFVDATPDRDEEFIQLIAGDSLPAIAGMAASGKYDLFTVVLHEQGHVLGLTDTIAAGDLMDAILSPGERKLPQQGQAENAEVGSVDGPAFVGAAMFVDSGQSISGAIGNAVGLGDFDDDGDLDAFVVNQSVDSKVWLNDGSGIFSDSGQSFSGGVKTDVQIADLDGDGDLDAFETTFSGNKIWLNDGLANFSLGQSLGSSRSTEVGLADLDGDGDFDAFVINRDQPNKVWFNNGSGSFTDSGQSLGNNNSNGISLGDVDGDGDFDAFVANRDQPNLVWLNDGSGNFLDSGQSLGIEASFEVSLDDLDGDGDLDAFVGNFAKSDTVWINNGSGIFTDSGQRLGANNFSSSTKGMSIGDLDNDGDLDAFLAIAFNHPSKVWLNNGLGNFTDSGQSLFGAPANNSTLGDLDNDGDLDAFVAASGATSGVPNPSEVWINQSPPVGPPPNSASVAAGNLTINADGDGDTVTLSVVGSDLKISTPDDSITGGAGTTTDPFGDVLVPIASLTSITLNTGDDDDIININSLIGFTGSLDIDGGDGQDLITFKADVSLAADNDANLTAERVDFVNAGVETAGAGSITVDATGGSGGNFQGIHLLGTDLTAGGTGTVSLSGQGGDTGSNNQGVWLTNSSTVSTNDGDIDIDGTGGGAGSSNQGVSIVAGSSISAGGSGNLTIDGTSSSAGTTSNDGIFLAAGTSASVENGDMNIVGTAAGGTGQSNGVYLGATLAGTGTGNISVTGSNSATGSSNAGISAANTSISTTAGSGSVTLSGTGSTSGLSNNDGVKLTNVDIATGGNGGIDIDGIGGGTGSGTTNAGVYLATGSTLAAAGTGAVTIDGTGGSGTNFNRGLYVIGAGSSITSVDGAMTIQGTGNGSVGTNRGVDLASATVRSTGIGAVTLRGTGSISSTGLFNTGVYLSSSTASATTGALMIDGNGGTGSSYNKGVHIQSSTVTTAGTLTLTGSAHGETTGLFNSGVYLYSATLDGNAATSTIEGTGGGGSMLNHGIHGLGLNSFGSLAGGNFAGNAGTGLLSKDLSGTFPV